MKEVSHGKISGWGKLNIRVIGGLHEPHNRITALLYFCKYGETQGGSSMKPTVDIIDFLSKMFSIEPPQYPGNPDELRAWFMRLFETMTDEEIIRLHELGFWQRHSRPGEKFNQAGREAFLNRYKQVTSMSTHISVNQ